MRPNSTNLFEFGLTVRDLYSHNTLSTTFYMYRCMSLSAKTPSYSCLYAKYELSFL